MVHDGTTEVTENEPYHGVEHIFDGWCHRHIMPQGKSKSSRIFKLSGPELESWVHLFVAEGFDRIHMGRFQGGEKAGDYPTSARITKETAITVAEA